MSKAEDRQQVARVKKKSARTSSLALRTSTRPSTTRSSRSPMHRAMLFPGLPLVMMGFKGSRKSTPYAAQMAAEDAGRKAQEHGMKDARSLGQGSGFGTRIRTARSAVGRFHIRSIKDITPFRTTAAVRAKRRRV
jgi:hypothetical protein